MIKAADEIFKLQDENKKLRKELAEYKDFLDLDTLEIYTENKRLKDGIKQAREKLDEMSKYTSVTGVTHYRQLNRDDVLAILDKLIEESEG